jgi:peptidoglycan/LPS O-acetylase OafA/YrhL
MLAVAERMGYLSDPSGGMIKLGTFFLAGGCFYLYQDRIQLNGKRACLAAGLLLVAMCSWRASELALATVGAYLLFYLAFKPSPFFARFNNLPDVSYGVYLYGWPVQKLFLWYFPLMSPWLLFPLSCIACLLLGTMSWYAIEGPCLRFKPQARSAKPLPSTP